jgi:hypothetical protein
MLPEPTWLTRSVSAAPSSPAPAPECSTSASRSAATDTASLRPRTDLPSTRALLPAGSVLRQKAVRHADFERLRQPFQGRQRRRRLLVFDFRDVGRGTDMRSASCRWLKPLRSRSDRIECASFRCPRPLEWMFTGNTSGAGVIAAISASSSSNDRWQRRQRLFDVRNCTKKQRSHRTTSRESTGANVVAIQVLRVPERGLLSKPTSA